jgi:hypothetical protein
MVVANIDPVNNCLSCRFIESIITQKFVFGYNFYLVFDRILNAEKQRVEKGLYRRIFNDAFESIIPASRVSSGKSLRDYASSIYGKHLPGCI